MRRFEFRDGKSAKFWAIDLAGRSFTVTFGRLGTKGQTQTKTFKDEAAALKEHDNLIKEKLGKGYVETTPTAKAQPTNLREALEAARFLCRCAGLAREDRSIPAANRDSLAQSYADRSMHALSSASQSGFRDSDDLKTSRLYDPLRGRDDFRRLVQAFDAGWKTE